MNLAPAAVARTVGLAVWLGGALLIVTPLLGDGLRARLLRAFVAGAAVYACAATDLPRPATEGSGRLVMAGLTLVLGVITFVRRSREKRPPRTVSG